MIKGIVFYIIMLVALCHTAAAQRISLFQSITVKDGLPSNYVQAIEEDTDGYLWLGTDKGLARYDGFSWKTFTTDDGLPGNYIGYIKKATKNSFWIGVGGKGLFLYNTNSKQAITVTKDYYHHYLQTDSSGNIFFYQSAPGSKKLKGCRVSPLQPQQIHTDFEIDLNKIKGTFATDFIRRQLILFNGENKDNGYKSSIFHTQWTLKQVNVLLEETSLYEPVADNIFENLSSLYFLRNKTVSKISIYDTSNTYFNSLPTPEGIWINNEKDGLYFVNNHLSKTHYTIADGLSSNIVVAMHRLRNGKIIFGTLGGGLCYKLPPGNAVIPTNRQMIKGLAQSDKNIYALTENNLLALDAGLTKGVQSFPISLQNVQGVNVWDNTIYLSSLTGFSINSIKGNNLIKNEFVKFGAGISNVIKSNNRIYAGSFGGNVIQYENNNIVIDSGSNQISEKILPIPGGYASLTYEDGVQFCYTNGQKITFTIKDGLPSNAVYDVHCYKDSIWVSTNSGVAVLTKNKLVKTITARNGLQGNRCLYSFHDNEGRYWIVTNSHLGRYDGDKVITYSSVPIKNGMQDVITACIFNAATNTLITGCAENIFINKLPAAVSKKEITAPTLLQILADGSEAKNSFSLRQNYDELSFHFRPADVTPFSKTVLYYKLKGSSDDFIELRDSLSVSFPHLPSGNYSLIAKTVNENGMESPEIVLSNFTIRKPFWESFWFIASLIGAGVVITYFITKKRQQKKQEALLKEKQMLLQVARERERISKELHDNLGTSLTTIIAQTDNIEANLRNQKNEEALHKAAQLSEQSRETMNILRETIWAVQEKEHSYTDFLNRIREFLQRTYSVTNTEWQLTGEGSTEKKLSPDQTLNLFRIVQEITQNIIKHAAATRATYQFNVTENNLSIQIADNGKGFDAEMKFNSNGLTNIKERMKELKGTVTIVTAPGKGTQILLTVTI